ncbi:HNH endonuclease signature motif containing protein [uncultured Corynebacterium sp.]|uniref:HNH endonuclease signature motif containing protein n=1 Tax=uncultured Corynebacterium sp. TaxID=159447 RepID=UPI0025976410|nr:HNH endonuclease signature motif containing protein [uncultured Corynebacterium sp.]
MNAVWNVSEASVDNDVAPAGGGLAGVDSLKDFKADLELLAEVSARVASRDADMWKRIEFDQREDYYALVTTSRRKLSNADVGFVNAHEDYMPLGKNKRPQWLVSEFRLTALEARGILAAAERLDGRVQGPDLRPSKKYMPKVHELVNEGSLDCEGIRRIDRAINSMPSRTHDLLVERGDQVIADLAEQCGPEVLNELSDLMWALLGEEEPEFEPKDHARKRSLRISRQGKDGMSTIRGTLTPRCAAVFQRLLADHGTTGGLLKDEELHSLGFNEDPRSPSQRAHDCLEAALFKSFSREERAILQEEFADWPDSVEEDGVDCGEDSSGGEFIPPLRDCDLKPRRGSTSIVAVVNLKDLLAGKCFGVTDTNMKIGMGELIAGTLARDFYLQVLDLNGRSLWLGRSQRLGSLDQYLALCGEEGGSTAPGSNAPPARCHIHHIDGWERGGLTDIENLTFADPRMHARVDDDRSNRNRWWTICADPSTGEKVIWLPPESDDPKRRPRRNLSPSSARTPGRRLQNLRRGAGRARPGKISGKVPGVVPAG